MPSPENYLLNRAKSPSKAWLFSFALACGYLAVCYLLIGQPGYETNDDVLMAMTAAGVGFAESPDPHLIYSHFLIGLVLNKLFNSMPSIPWYGIYLTACQLLSLTVVFRFLARRFTSTASIFVIALTMLLFLRPVMMLQFTSAAALLAVAGSVVFLFGLEHTGLATLQRKCLSGSVGLFSLCAMIRNQSAVLFLVLVLAMVLIGQLVHFDRNKLKRAACFFIAIAASFSLINVSNFLFYENDPQWKGLYGHCGASWTLLNTDRLIASDHKTKEVLNQAGWTPTEVEIFQSWFFLHPKFSDQVLKKLDQSLPRINPYLNLDPDLIKNSLNTLELDLSLLPILVAFAIAFFFTGSNKLKPKAIALSSLTLLLLCLVIILFYKFPARIYANLFIFTATIYLLYLSPEKIRSNFKTASSSTAAVLTIAVAMVLSANWYHARAASLDSDRIALKNYMQELRKRPDTLYVIWSGEFPYEAIGPFEDIHKYFSGIKLLGFNSLLDSPIFYKRMKEFGISNLLNQLDDENLRFIVSDLSMCAIEDFTKKEYKKYPIFLPDQVSDIDDNLELLTYRVEFDQSGENSKLPTRIEIDSSLLLYPDKAPSKYFDAEIEKTTKEGTVFKVTGKQPIISLSLDDKYIKLDDYSYLFVELAVDKAITNNRKLCFWVKKNKSQGQLCFRSIRQDSDLHTYFYEIDRIMHKKDDRLTHLNINPLFKRSYHQGEIFVLGRAGLVKK
ncbi:MAG: hypothetical protein R3F51_16335 [Cyanobacteriota/Melainabacteria group bacterium]